MTYFCNFLRPLHISGTVEAINFKFNMHRSRGALPTKCKIRSRRVGKVSRDLLLTFWDPLYISVTVEARNFKFGTHIDNEGH